MTQLAEPTRNNLNDWVGAQVFGTVDLADPVVPERTAAAAEILDDPHWAAKIRRALNQSDRGLLRSLQQHRDELA